MVTRRTPLTSVTALRDKGVYWPQPREEALGPPKGEWGKNPKNRVPLVWGSTQQLEGMIVTL